MILSDEMLDAAPEMAADDFDATETVRRWAERTKRLEAELVQLREAVKYPEAAEVCAEAYQVVGVLLDALDLFDTPEGEKILDNLSEHRMVHNDVLPWTLGRKGE